MKTKEQLVDAVIEDLMKSINEGDLTTLEEILGFVPTRNLIKALPEEKWSEYEEVFTNEQLAIDLERMLDGAEQNPIEKIDWSDLRNLKTTLAYIWDEMTEGDKDDIRGLLLTIGELQDYAVNGLGINSIHIYDYDVEDYLEKILNN